jgi:ABC-type branched-subunit amino acid transport system substrate-binding protein
MPPRGCSMKHMNAYGTEPGIAAPNVYDIINLIVYGFENARTENEVPSSAEVATALATVKDFPGSLGPLAINEDGVVISQASVREIRDGKPVTIG